MFVQFGAPELLILLVIIVLLFGVVQIGKIAGELGNGLRSFARACPGKAKIKPDRIINRAHTRIARTESILEIALRHAQQANATCVTDLYLVIGQLSSGFTLVIYKLSVI